MVKSVWQQNELISQGWLDKSGRRKSFSEVFGKQAESLYKVRISFFLYKNVALITEECRGLAPRTPSTSTSLGTPQILQIFLHVPLLRNRRAPLKAVALSLQRGTQTLFMHCAEDPALLRKWPTRKHTHVMITARTRTPALTRKTIHQE